MHAPAPVYDLSRWWCDTWQKVQHDAQPPVYRYYRLCLRQDLWGQWELIRCWGKIGQKASRTSREAIASPEAAEAIRLQVQKIRRQHRYLPVAALLPALDLADIKPGSEPPTRGTAEHTDAEETRGASLPTILGVAIPLQRPPQNPLPDPPQGDTSALLKRGHL